MHILLVLFLYRTLVDTSCKTESLYLLDDSSPGTPHPLVPDNHYATVCLYEFDHSPSDK